MPQWSPPKTIGKKTFPLEVLDVPGPVSREVVGNHYFDSAIWAPQWQMSLEHVDDVGFAVSALWGNRHRQPRRIVLIAEVPLELPFFGAAIFIFVHGLAEWPPLTDHLLR